MWSRQEIFHSNSSEWRRPGAQPSTPPTHSSTTLLLPPQPSGSPAEARVKPKLCLSVFCHFLRCSRPIRHSCSQQFIPRVNGARRRAGPTSPRLLRQGTLARSVFTNRSMATARLQKRLCQSNEWKKRPACAKRITCGYAEELCKLPRGGGSQCASMSPCVGQPVVRKIGSAQNENHPAFRVLSCVGKHINTAKMS